MNLTFDISRALQLIPPTTVAVIRVTEIVMAYVLQSLFMNQVSDKLHTFKLRESMLRSQTVWQHWGHPLSLSVLLVSRQKI